jgi:bacillithiol biosynthesis cysteine-adding enzyme BshC
MKIIRIPDPKRPLSGFVKSCDFDTVRQQVLLQDFPREALTDILLSYNRRIGNDARAFDEIDRLKQPDRLCIVTGQQMGLLGGPTYLVLKALTCLLLAREMDATPIFWLATEDHDVSEVNHTYLLDSFGNIEKHTTVFPRDGRPVEDLVLSGKNVEVIEHLLEALNLPKNLFVKEGESYALAMAHFLASQFAGTGLVFIEPKELRPLSIPFFKKEIEEAKTILNILQETTSRLIDAGGTAVLSFREATQLFLKENHHRQKIRFDGSTYSTGTNHYFKQQLLSLAENEPERFSLNAAARPVLQSLLIPTLAYVAGPSEVAYFQQLSDYHRFHHVTMPCIVPRLSATLIPHQGTVFLEQCHLKPWQAIPHHWIELMPDLAASVQSLYDEWNQCAFRHFQHAIAPEILSRYVRWTTRKIQHKLCKSRLKSQGIASHALHYLRNLIHPHEKQQERVLNWWNFQGDAQENLIHAFLNEAQWQIPEHLYCFIY